MESGNYYKLQFEQMGNSCCNHHEINQLQLLNHIQILALMIKSIENLDSNQDDDELILPMQKYTTLSAVCKIELYYTLDKDEEDYTIANSKEISKNKPQQFIL
ncbi:unnamed protein product (macronuclear) [Paramecium tetraurelia]|uniref:Uncharacterized protein n=1 Tax=Paramecium tetraurelia TaxID=5888 RepID=A0BE97_PARTE|nr:uncharacterized protein GSPATT00027897001 [Paramecium tetraurelia]CAK56864.1 unnamed protein product [Paramecium tetraurelia]|eukprot:XP_001424262.1 hypothetical protein (macronuclear) [Paramecium tetraurelia strain d4-2]